MWSPAQVEQMSTRFTAAAGPVGTQTFERVRALMEPEVAAWARESTAACQLEDETARRLRQLCLEARGQTLSTMVSLFSEADRSVVDSAVLTLGLEVRAVESCQTSASALPKLQDTEADQQLRPRLAPARVLRAAWRFEDARAVATDVAAEAAERGAPHVLAEAQLLAGQLSADLQEPSAPQRLQRAIELAEAAGSDEVRARAWMTLISLHALRREFPVARDADKQAVAIVQRLGWPEVLEAQLRNQEGNLQLALGDLDGAHTAYLRQRELLQRYRPETDPLVSRATNNVLLSGGSEGRIEGFQALLERTSAALGPNHPETLFTRHNLAAALLASGRCEEATAEVGAVLDTRLTGGPHHQPLLQGEYLLQARTLACLKRYPEALAAHRKGFELLQQSSAPETEQRTELSWQLTLMRDAGSPPVELARVEQELKQLNP
jgi:tetratricopeptide (TPR) repeat protein